MLNNYNKTVLGTIVLILSIMAKLLISIIIDYTIFDNEPLIILFDNITTVLLCLIFPLTIVLNYTVYEFCRKHRITAKNFYKSLLATQHLRKFCMQHSNLNFQGSTDPIIDKINHSLLKLEVVYNDNSGKLTWFLPDNQEIQKKIKEMFPAIREELNAFDSDYIFSDISREKRNRYTASATRIK